MLSYAARPLRRNVLSEVFTVLAVMFGLIGLFLLWDSAAVTRREKEAQAAATARMVAGTIRTVMINGRGDLASEVLARLGTLPDFSGLRVYRVDGTEAFKDLATLMDVVAVLQTGGRADLGRELHDRVLEHRSGSDPPARLVSSALEESVRTGRPVSRHEQIDGEEILTYFLPLRNERPCQACHRSDHAVRGVIVLSLPTAPLQAALYRRSIGLAVALGVTALALGLGLMWSLNRTVLKPVQALVAALESDEPARSLREQPASGTREFAVLGRALQESMNRITAARAEIRKLAAFPRLHPHPIVELAADGSIGFVNGAASTMAEALGLDGVAGLLPADRAALVDACLVDRRPVLRHEVAIGGRTLSWLLFPIAETRMVHAYAEDVTEHRRLEAQLQRAQKTEAIGRLASGIAHDFNNLLTVIEGRAQLLLHGSGLEEAARRAIGIIDSTAQRAAALTQQLLAFSRRQVLQPKVLDLNGIVMNMLTLLQRLIGEDVELAPLLEPGLGRITADPSQIEQVIMNLAVNARDAMVGGGKLTVETANVELDEVAAPLHGGLPPGPYVLLAVSDTGSGMDATTRAHLFEPFFTTKTPGKGTGLGLSTVYGIVTQTRGHIGVYSEPGSGTTFKIYLPRTDAPLEPAGAAPRREAPARGTETVLLVEDEDEVRELARESLEAHGYQVLAARDGAEGIEIAEGLGSRIDLLVTDVVMPQVGGPDLARRLGAMRPDLKVLYISGYVGGALAGQGGLDAAAALLPKPFSPDALVRKVREVLDEPI